jgi:hypothetical protein
MPCYVRLLLRLRDTHQPPELPSTNHSWHVFLSHKWPTGQEQCASIRRQLMAQVPSLSVFLDVFDLNDTDKLEEYVGESTSVLLFLSRGYFLSANCLREVEAAVASAKPIILVHDAEAQSGGAPMSDLVAECPEPLRRVLFDSSEVVIPWIRKPAFQIESIVLIAEAVLTATRRHQRMSVSASPRSNQSSKSLMHHLASRRMLSSKCLPSCKSAVGREGSGSKVVLTASALTAI